jgi:mono/diheme cytochrome c family protein
MSMSFRFIPTVAALICCWCLPVAAEQTTGEDAAPKINFEDHIKPIFRQHCLSCHNQGESKGGLALDTHGALMTGGGSGEIVYDGDVEGSRLWQLVTHEDTPVMPPGQDKIPDEQIKLIADWIQGGLLENAGSKAAKKKTSSLAFVSTGSGKPEGPAAMPDVVPQAVPVVTPRAAAITAVAASPWAPLIAVAGQRQVVLYHSETGVLLGVFPFPEGVPQSLRFSRDGAYLVAAGGEHAASGLAAIYDVKTGERLTQVGDEYDVAFDADVNDDLSRVALGGPQKMLRVYSTADGERLFDIKKHTDWIYAVAFSPDGVLIASGDRSAGLLVWEAETGRQFLDLGEHKGAINAIAWRDDSNVFASASDDGSVKLWDVVAGKSIKTITAHPGGATAVAFDHQGRLVTAGKDRKVKLWDASGNPVHEFPAMEEAVLTVAVTHDGSRVVAGDWNGKVLISKSDDPKSSQAVAANPPPAEARLKEQTEQLAAVEPEYQKSLTQSQTLAAKLAETSKQRNSLVAKRDKAAAAAKAAQDAAKTSLDQANAMSEELSKLVLASRDQHDLVIAGRVGNLDSVEAQQLVADRETELAATLQKMAQLRRDQIAARTQSLAKQTEATQLNAEAEAMQEPIKLADAAVAEAKAASEAVAKQHSEVAAQKELLEKLVAQLRQAVQ